MAAATAGSPSTQGFAPPRARRGRAAGPAAQGNGAGADGDEAMTDDMRLAVSALGLMRDGPAGSEGAPPPASSSSSAALASTSRLPPPSTSSAAGSVFALPPVPSRYRAASSSRRSDPSRSTSTASTASASEAWTGATSDTGYSSPAGSASIAGGGAGAADDTDMLADKHPHPHPEDEAGGDPRFMARVSQLPVVSSGIEWYERSKANSRVVKYGAGLVESSFSAVSRPVANALPPLGPLDDFACRQLDRIGAPGASPGRKSPSTALPPHEGDEEMRGRGSGTSPPHRGGEYDGAMVVQRGGDERGSSAGSNGQQIATVGGGRSRWQTVLLEAGGLGAAVSEESLKSLRYCLQWLLYATAHLDHQISTLRDFILSLRAHNRSSSPSSSNALVAASASAHLAQIKHDVVETIRKVVDVMSKYAGAALPEQAKRYVRQSILGLPVKWASAIEGRGGASGRATRESTVDGSELGTPRPERMGDAYFPGPSAGGAPAGSSSGVADGKGDEGQQGAQDPALRPTEEAADRILTFAVESLDMLRSVTGIFGESVERAEAWIERLRVVGLDRQRQRAAASETSADGDVSALPPSPQVGSSATFDDGAPTLAAGTKRRRTTPSSSLSSSMHAEMDSAPGADTGVSTALEVGQETDEGDDGAATRRKRGAWRVDGEDAGAGASA
ncbi:transcriptional regulator opi1 [Rhodotorula kratochvilovae]